MASKASTNEITASTWASARQKSTSLTNSHPRTIPAELNSKVARGEIVQRKIRSRAAVTIEFIRDESSSDSDDPDFGSEARNAVRAEAEEIRQRDEELKRKREAKALGIKYVAPRKPRQRARTPPQRSIASEAGKSRSSRSAYRADELQPTVPTFDPTAKASEIRRARGITIQQRDRHSDLRWEKRRRVEHENSSDEHVDRSHRDSDSSASSNRQRDLNTDEDEDDEVKRHLKRLWVNKSQPERMTKAQAKMEEKHNPLIKLLNIRLIIDDESEPDSSDDGCAPEYSTDEENKVPVTRSTTPSFAPPPHWDSSRFALRLDEKEADIKPVITTDIKPDVTTAIASDESSGEEEDYPFLAPGAQPTAATLHSSFQQAVKEDSDSGSEPSTAEDEPMLSVAIPSTVLSREHPAAGPTSHIKTAESSGPYRSGPLLARRPEKPSGDMTALVRYEQDPALRDSNDRQQARRDREQAQLQAELAQIDMIRKAASERKNGAASDAEIDEDEDEEDVEELSLLELAALEASQPKKVYPIAVKKGRPKFQLQSESQERTGPHRLPPNNKHQIPAPINKFLRKYQREGVEFLYRQYTQGIGGILGDDMGLGKTIQVIAFLSAVMGKTGYKQHDQEARKKAIRVLPRDAVFPKPSDHGATCLVVCPTSVVHNWAREFQTWSYIDVAVYSGTVANRKQQLEAFRHGYMDVVIAGIETVRTSITELADEDFTMVIVDEAHRVKDPRSQTTKALHQFPTRLRYGLTGTAIQNRLSEFWCILDWAVPGKVGVKKQWEDLVSRPLKMAQKIDATDDELTTGRERSIALVTLLLPHFWLRRTKHDPAVNLQLPQKIDQIVLCPLTDLQKDVYKRLLELEDVKIILTAEDPCPCGARDEDNKPYKRGNCCEQGWAKMIFRYMTLFGKVANHLALLYPDKQDRIKNEDKYTKDVEWARAAFPEDFDRRKRTPETAFDDTLCGKWKILCELLNVWKENGDKVLVFSMSLKILDLLKELFHTKSDYEYEVLDGSTPNEERMERCDRFNDPNSEVFVFLLSTRAGGVGLNLTAANRVVIFDPNWNPSHDLQAMDRSYRFGQQRDVYVYRLIGAGTLEELILNRQQYKRALAGVAYDADATRRLYQGVEGDKSQRGELYGVRNIFKYSEHFSLTEKSIKQCELADTNYTGAATLDDEDFDDEKAPAKIFSDHLDENNEILGAEVVQELTGLGDRHKAEKNKLSVGKAAQLAKVKQEQERIASILGGLVTIESDKTLGSSKAEEARTKDLLRRKQMAGLNKNERKLAGHSVVGDDIKVARRPIARTGEPVKWDPLKRGQKRKAPVAEPKNEVSG